jgi:hypothetical protein
MAEDQLNLSPKVTVKMWEDPEKRTWSYEMDPDTGDLTVTIPTKAYEKSPQTAREWSVLAGVTGQLGPVFELITGANASPTGRVQ